MKTVKKKALLTSDVRLILATTPACPAGTTTVLKIFLSTVCRAPQDRSPPEAAGMKARNTLSVGTEDNEYRTLECKVTFIITSRADTLH